MAAAFEETGRYFAMRFVLRRLDGKNALMYGAGHGGVEAMLLLGLTSINNIVNSTLINSGSLPGVLEGLDEATTQTVLEGVSQLWTAPSYLFFIGGLSASSPSVCTSPCRCCMARRPRWQGQLVLGGLRGPLCQ